MNIPNFQYMFDAYPPIIKSGTFYFLTGISLLLFFLGILFKEVFIKKQWLRKRIDRYQKVLIIKLSDIATTFGVINLFLIMFRKLRVPYFQMRFVMILWFMIILAWLISVIQYQLVKVPKLREEDEKRKKYEQYIK